MESVRGFMSEIQDWKIVCPYRYLFKKENAWYCKEPSRLEDPVFISSTRLKDPVGFKRCEIEHCHLRYTPLNLYYITHETDIASTTYHFTSKLSFEDLPNCKTIARILEINYNPCSVIETLWKSKHELPVELEKRIK
jgi:hypothetical protein